MNILAILLVFIYTVSGDTLLKSTVSNNTVPDTIIDELKEYNMTVCTYKDVKALSLLKEFIINATSMLLDTDNRDCMKECIGFEECKICDYNNRVEFDRKNSKTNLTFLSGMIFIIIVLKSLDYLATGN